VVSEWFVAGSEREKKGKKTRGLSSSAGKTKFFVVLVLVGFSGLYLKSIPQN
jgi:hypothetical protein